MTREVSEEDLDEVQEDLQNNYNSLHAFFDDIEAISDIQENLFTIEATGRFFNDSLSIDFTDDIPEFTVMDLLENAHEHVMEEQIANELDARRIFNNIPADHNLLQLFLETFNPEMNANELNDDDIAAIQEQYNEILMMQQGQVQNEEEEWQQDWISDEE